MFGEALVPPDILPGLIAHVAPGLVATDIVALAGGTIGGGGGVCGQVALKVAVVPGQTTWLDGFTELV